ncbi:low-density lipoprotein receptor-related protein 3-like [Lytechinus pictus]|uniref:low-density lipoprotein receptor-related protein 3-like n=1 Tax=Lytechinus pictus TaxID=7653 RepID=UPI0030BA244F
MLHLTGQQLVFLMVIPLFIQSVISISLAPLAACPADDPDRREQQGEITSPNYPDEYPNGSQCKWRIYHDPDEVVTISFTVFGVEDTDGGDCSSDYLVIEDKKQTRKYCGYDRPAPYISDPTTGSKTIIIRFESDQRVTGIGFLLEYYKSQQNLESCPDVESDFLCQNHRCIPREWVCNQMNECGDYSDEAVDICHSEPSQSPATGTPTCPPHTIYCLKNDGTTSQCLPEDKKCDGNKDCYGNEDEIGCQVTCVHEMPPPSGSFSSPNFPGNYQNNLDCRWTLIVSEGNIIQLRFVAFDVEQGYRRDYVTVYDGGSISADVIGYFYGYEPSSSHYPPTVIEGSGNRLYVTFVTDGTSTNTGFNATYQSKGDCIDGQRICSATDTNCYAQNERCDGKLTCLKGEDEQGCNECPEGEIPCSDETPVRCYSSAERCNGQPRCAGKEDELDCPASLCGGEHGLFLCGSKKCIKENWICDSNVDCPDSTDEMNCPMSPKVITAAVVGSIVCGLLLVAALSCTCKLYQLYHSDPHPPTHTSPLSEIEDELMRREAPPSYTASMSSPHFDEAQRAFIESLQAAAQARTSSNRSGRSSRRRNNSQPDRETAQQQNTPGASSPDSVNTTQDTISTTASTPGSPNPDNTPSSEPVDDSSSPYTEITELQQTQNLGGDTASSCTTDTDSDTNAEAELEQRDHEIIRAATNIRRMRLAGGIQTIVDSVTNRQREGAGEEETRRRSSSGLQNIIERVNRTRENQQRGEDGTSGPNSPTGVSPPLPVPDGTRTPPNTQESSVTSEDDHSPEWDNELNHHSTSSADGNAVAQSVPDSADQNISSSGASNKPSSNSLQPPPSPSPSSRSDDAPLDLSNSYVLNDEDSTLINDDEEMLLAK